MTDALDKLAERLPEVAEYTFLRKLLETEKHGYVDMDACDAALAACAAEVERLESGHDTLQRRVFRLGEEVVQAEAELAALRCCGNCGHLRYVEIDYEGAHLWCREDPRDSDRTPYQPCTFTPSRWTTRDEP